MLGRWTVNGPNADHEEIAATAEGKTREAALQAARRLARKEAIAKYGSNITLKLDWQTEVK